MRWPPYWTIWPTQHFCNVDVKWFAAVFLKCGVHCRSTGECSTIMGVLCWTLNWKQWWLFSTINVCNNWEFNNKVSITIMLVFTLFLWPVMSSKTSRILITKPLGPICIIVVFFNFQHRIMIHGFWHAVMGLSVYLWLYSVTWEGGVVCYCKTWRKKGETDKSRDTDCRYWTELSFNMVWKLNIYVLH